MSDLNTQLDQKKKEFMDLYKNNNQFIQKETEYFNELQKYKTTNDEINIKLKNLTNENALKQKQIDELISEQSNYKKAHSDEINKQIERTKENDKILQDRVHV